MSTLVRLATAADAEGLIELNRLFDNVDNEEAMGITAVQYDLHNNPTETVFVAQLDEHLAGFATLQLTHTFISLRPTAELTGIFVRPEPPSSGDSYGSIHGGYFDSTHHGANNH